MDSIDIPGTGPIQSAWIGIKRLGPDTCGKCASFTLFSILTLLIRHHCRFFRSMSTGTFSALETAINNIHLDLPPVPTTPILLTPNSASRGARRLVLRNALHNINDHYTTLDRLIRKLAVIRDALHLQSAAVENAIAPVSAIPPEILRLVFHEAVAAENHQDGAVLAASLAQVSALWRAVAIGQGGLWENIDLSPHPSYRRYPITLVDAVMERSTGHPRNLTLHHKAMPHWSRRAMRNSRVRGSLRSLSITDYGGAIQKDLSNNLHQSFPALERLSITFERSDETGDDEMELDISPDVSRGRVEMPKLRHLSLSQVHLFGTIHIGTILSSLTLHDITLDPMWKTLSQDCPVLTNLSVTHIYFTPDITPQTMPHLRHFKLVNHRNDYSHHHLFPLRAPHLSEFELGCWGPWYSGALVRKFVSFVSGAFEAPSSPLSH